MATHRKDLHCSICAGMMWRSSTSAADGSAICNPCRRATYLDRHKPGQAGYSRGCRCDGCRSAHSASLARARDKRRGGAYDPLKLCTVCGSTFAAPLHATRACSDACRLELRRRKRRQHKAAKRGQFVEAVVPADIFERDGWRCHICRRKLNRANVVPHLRAATVDHLVPLSLGGTHERANCKTACYSCNCAKGNRGGNEQLLLIG